MHKYKAEHYSNFFKVKKVKILYETEKSRIPTRKAKRRKANRSIKPTSTPSQKQKRSSWKKLNNE